MEKVSAVKVQIVDGRPCVVFDTQNGPSVAIPLEGFESAVDEAHRQLISMNNSGDPIANQWLRALPYPVRTLNVDLLEPIEQQTVLLTIDRGLPGGNLSFALKAELAHPLAEELLRVAGQLAPRILPN